MQITKIVRLIFTFYSGFAFASLCITACCLVSFWQYGLSVIVPLVWFKIAMAGIFYFFINEYKQKEYYYYQNLGISKKLLWTASLSFDMAFFILLLTQIHHFK